MEPGVVRFQQRTDTGHIGDFLERDRRRLKESQRRRFIVSTNVNEVFGKIAIRLGLPAYLPSHVRRFFSARKRLSPSDFIRFQSRADIGIEFPESIAASNFDSIFALVSKASRWRRRRSRTYSLAVPYPFCSTCSSNQALS
jgi:hypothetical protein